LLLFNCLAAVCACYHTHAGFPGQPGMLTQRSAWQHELPDLNSAQQ
jgi:hypothetical protein